LVATKNIATQKSLMQPILGCNNKYGNQQKRKCNQFLVARVNRPVHLAYQPPASSTFLSQRISYQQPASSTFLSEQTSISH
jgi:hypothetical protein